MGRAAGCSVGDVEDWWVRMDAGCAGRKGIGDCMRARKDRNEMVVLWGVNCLRLRLSTAI